MHTFDNATIRNSLLKALQGGLEEVSVRKLARVLYV